MSSLTITQERRVKVVFDADGTPLKTTVTDIEKTVNKTTKTINEAGQDASKAGGLFGKFGEDVKAGIAMGFGMSTVGMVTSAIGMVKNGIAQTVNLGMEYEATMSQVKAITNATGSEMSQMSSLARQLGADTVKSASEAGEAMVYMGMAGWDTQQIMSGLPAVMNLSIASGAEFARVSDIVTDNLTAFGMEAEDAGYYSDVLAYAMSHANVNMDSLGESLKYIAPVASGAGVAMEEVVAMVSLLGDAGIKGSQAGTTLRSVILNLTGANEKATAKLKELGVEIHDSDGKMRSMTDIMKDLSSKLVDANGNIDTTTATLLVGKTAVSGFTALLRAGGDNLGAFTKALEDSSGSAQRMADTMADNLSGAVEDFKGTMEELGLQLYDKVKPALTATMEGVNALFDSFVKSEETSQVFSIFGQTVSEATYNALSGVQELTTGIEEQMGTLALMGNEVTPAFVSQMLNNYTGLKTGILDTVNQMHDEELSAMLTFGEERLGMTEEQLDKLHQSMDTYREEHIAKATELEERAKEIMAQYDGEETKMTKAHQQELLDINNEFKKLSIETMTSELDDKKNLLKTYSSESFKITKENAQNILQTAVQHKENIVKTAQERLDEELAVVGNMYRIGAVSEKEYNEMVATAQKNYDTMVADSDKSFAEIVKKLQTNLGEDAPKIAKQGGDKVWEAYMKAHKQLQGDVKKETINPVLDPKEAIRDAKNLISDLGRIFSKKFTIDTVINKKTVHQNVYKKDIHERALISQINSMTGRSVGLDSVVTANMSRNVGDTNINFNGQYSFANQRDIDYFLKQTARAIDRRY